MTLPARKETLVLVTLTAIQFTNILDFVIMMPLGPQLMRLFGISPQEFGLVVSAYTFTAGITGFLASFFLDRFDRKRSLLVLYGGFAVGTFLCSVAPTFYFLLGARIVAGAFGGVLGAVVMTIVSDIIPYERRGAAMGMVMSSFSLAQVAGVPIGLFLANKFSWHAPFVVLAGVALVLLVLGSKILPEIRTHLNSPKTEQAWRTVLSIFSETSTLRALAFMSTLVFAGFSIIPYISPYFVRNVGVAESDLPYIYFSGGLATLVSSRVIGKLADKYGKLPVFTVVASLSVFPILVLTHLPQSTLSVAIVTTVFFMVLVSGRVVPSMAMVSASVQPQRRGTFLSINSSITQLAAGASTFIAGFMIGKSQTGALANYGLVGYLSFATTIVCIALSRTLTTVDVSPPQTTTPQP
jgi:predicted MFS family arabinose efflux permease